MKLSTMRALLGLLVLVLFKQQSAVAATANFDGFTDSTILMNQLSGLTFSNTIILSSGTQQITGIINNMSQLLSFQ